MVGGGWAGSGRGLRSAAAGRQERPTQPIARNRPRLRGRGPSPPACRAVAAVAFSTGRTRWSVRRVQRSARPVVPAPRRRRRVWLRRESGLRRARRFRAPRAAAAPDRSSRRRRGRRRTAARPEPRAQARLIRPQTRIWPGLRRPGPGRPDDFGHGVRLWRTVCAIAAKKPVRQGAPYGATGPDNEKPPAGAGGWVSLQRWR